MLNQIFNEDCLEGMKRIPDGSVDMILCDLPYGTTQCQWDSIIPLGLLWKQYTRIIKCNGAIVLTGCQPFTSILVCSNLTNFKYCWIWRKTKATGFFDAKKRPLNNYEDVAVFYLKPPTYNPQMSVAKRVYKRGFVKRKKSDCYGDEKDFMQKDTGMRYPRRVIDIPNADTRGIFHPTQKPVGLFEYLIKTYTNPGDIVMDNCMGSGTTAIACINTGRNYIGFEMDKTYYEAAQKRIAEHQPRLAAGTEKEGA